MISFAGVNWLAVLVGVVATNAFGFLWYGPLFGNAWMRMIGKTADEIESAPMIFVVTALQISLLIERVISDSELLFVIRKSYAGSLRATWSSMPMDA